MASNKSAHSVGLSMEKPSVEGKPPAPAALKSTAKSRKPAIRDVREPKDKVPMKTASATPERETYTMGAASKKFVAAERTVPVTVEQKFEDRVFSVSVDDLRHELREFALRQVELPYKGPGANPEITIKVEPIYEGGGTEGGELEHLQFTVSFPLNN